MKVWVLDDEPDVLTFLTTVLEDEEYEVRGFESVDELLGEVRRSPPDLLCLDIMMPGRSGLSLYRELRSSERLRDIPIIIVSGYSRQEEFLEGEFQRLLGSGDEVPEPDGFIEKPVRMDELLGLVRKLLGRRHP
jgi:DNA-binding response OmpR family regulator